MFIDLHCDTLCYFSGLKEAEVRPIKRMPNESLYENNSHIDFKRMKKAGQMAQFFAVFMLPDHGEDGTGPKADYLPEDSVYIGQLANYLKEQCAAHEDIINFTRNCREIMENHKNGKMSAFLTIEDGRSVLGSFDNLQKLFDMGVRLITLTWNFKNCFGSPNSPDPAIMAEGLTDFGKEAILWMNKKGMLVDVSHLSDGGFWDVLKISEKPVVASHSNCRALSPHPRNLTDEMIKALANKGGVSGINYFSRFLHEDIEWNYSTVGLIVKHIKYMRNVGGIDVVALGSDMDGVDCEIEVNSPDKVVLIFDALKKEGFSESEIDKIAWQNALRVIKDCM